MPGVYAGPSAVPCPYAGTGPGSYSREFIGEYNSPDGVEHWIWWYVPTDCIGDDLERLKSLYIQYLTTQDRFSQLCSLSLDDGLYTYGEYLAKQEQESKERMQCLESMISMANEIIDLGGIVPIVYRNYGLPTKGTVTSVFGERTAPTWIDENGKVRQGTSRHYGWDIANKQGTEVDAVENGVVIYAKYMNDSNGNVIVVDHGFGIFSYYFHVQNMNVKEGDFVSRGSQIAEIGNKGTGPHLHFAMSSGGEMFTGYYNPIDSVPGLADLSYDHSQITVNNGNYSNIIK